LKTKQENRGYCFRGNLRQATAGAQWHIPSDARFLFLIYLLLLISVSLNGLQNILLGHFHVPQTFWPIIIFGSQAQKSMNPLQAKFAVEFYLSGDFFKIFRNALHRHYGVTGTLTDTVVCKDRLISYTAVAVESSKFLLRNEIIPPAITEKKMLCTR
jgi:hypothetical protein